MLLTLRLMAAATAGSTVFIALALYFVIAPSPDDPTSVVPPVTYLLGVLAVVVVVHLLVEAVGYRAARAVPPGATPEQASSTAGQTFLSLGLLRIALSESVVFLGVAAAFVLTEGSYVLFLTAALGGLVLLAVHAWPGERAVRKVEASLEREGGASMLRRTLG